MVIVCIVLKIKTILMIFVKDEKWRKANLKEKVKLPMFIDIESFNNLRENL